jgi:hypothetical protein
LASFHENAFGIYAERRFMLAELSSFSGIAVVPRKQGSWAAILSRRGFAEFNSSQIAFAHARNMGPLLAAGVQFGYCQMTTGHYARMAAFSAEGGLLFRPSEHIQTGLRISNPAGASFGRYADDLLPALFAFGLAYEPSDRFFISTEIVKEEKSAVSVNAGFYYRFIDAAVLRTCVATGTSTLCVGIGILLPFVRMDFIISYHPQLGATPGLFLSYPSNHFSDTVAE